MASDVVSKQQFSDAMMILNRRVYRILIVSCSNNLITISPQHTIKHSLKSYAATKSSGLSIYDVDGLPIGFNSYIIQLYILLLRVLVFCRICGHVRSDGVAFNFIFADVEATKAT